MHYKLHREYDKERQVKCSKYLEPYLSQIITSRRYPHLQPNHEEEEAGSPFDVIHVAHPMLNDTVPLDRR